MKIIIITVLIIGVISVLISFFRSGHLIKNLLITAFQGILSLLAVNVTGLATGVTLFLNWYTIAAVSFFGLPGTITLTILKFIFR